MRFALLLGLLSTIQALLYESFNGIVDGNVCTGGVPPSGTAI
jgi:hypothetical protein